jgi:uncharacterized protein (TIGR02118 family)
MVKVIALIRRRDDIDRAEFLRHWQIDHPAYVRRLRGIRRYVQNPGIEHRRAWPYDGVAELWFDSVRDVAAAFDSPEADEMREHEERFIGVLEWLLADETEVPVAAPSKER